MTRYLTVKDVAGILGTTTQTVNAWIRNGSPKMRPPLWTADTWCADSSGRRTLRLQHLNEDALSPIQNERLHLAQLRAERPESRRAA